MQTNRIFKFRNALSAALVTAGLFVASLSAMAGTITYSASGTNTYSGNNNPLSAGVIFDYDGSSVLKVTLQNTVAGGAYVPSDVLTDLFWTDSSSATFTPVSAALGAGSTVVNAPASYDLGKEWQFLKGLSGPGGTNAGIGSSGLGIFGSGNFSAGGNPTDGMNYGIISGVNAAANPAVNSGVFVQDAMVFTLTVGAGFSLSSISNVYFQYGTALGEPLLAGQPSSPSNVPEPGAVAMLATMGTSSLCFIRRRATLRKA